MLINIYSNSKWTVYIKLIKENLYIYYKINEILFLNLSLIIFLELCIYCGCLFSTTITVDVEEMKLLKDKSINQA